MIQRIQSIYLSAVVAVTILMFFLPVINIELAGKYYFLNLTGVKQNINGNNLNYIYAIPLSCISAFVGILSFVAVFLFKKRQVQIKICKINFLLNIILILLVFYFYPDIIIKNKLGSNVSCNFSIGAVLPLANMILILLANKAIRKDEKIVKESYRIR
ncbi:MAG: DUF4293 domain-containing protein [Bacteroidales bacterium]|nr:DUF4293 domain-containing protein [Bacteroidales bacterium]